MRRAGRFSRLGSIRPIAPNCSVPANPPPLFLTIADDDPSVAPLSTSRLLRCLAPRRWLDGVARLCQWRARLRHERRGLAVGCLDRAAGQLAAGEGVCERGVRGQRRRPHSRAGRECSPMDCPPPGHPREGGVSVWLLVRNRASRLRGNDPVYSCRDRTAGGSRWGSSLHPQPVRAEEQAGGGIDAEFHHARRAWARSRCCTVICSPLCPAA